jgi:hypothetical protein
MQNSMDEEGADTATRFGCQVLFINFPSLGWITLATLMTFRRLASLSTDPFQIADAIEKSSSTLARSSDSRWRLSTLDVHFLLISG